MGSLVEFMIYIPLCWSDWSLLLQTLIAKQTHFAYSTPRKTLVFRLGRYGSDKPFDLGEDEMEAPAAPLQKKRYRRINRNEDNSGVSVALFNWIKPTWFEAIDLVFFKIRDWRKRSFKLCSYILVWISLCKFLLDKKERYRVLERQALFKE